MSPQTHTKLLNTGCYYRICSMIAPSQPSGEESFGKRIPQAAGSNNRVHTRRKSTEPTRENFSPLQLHLPKDFPSLMETNMENSELPFRFITTKGLVQKLPKMHQEAPDSNLPLSGWAKAEEHPANL